MTFNYPNFIPKNGNLTQKIKDDFINTQITVNYYLKMLLIILI